MHYCHLLALEFDLRNARETLEFGPGPERRKGRSAGRVRRTPFLPMRRPCRAYAARRKPRSRKELVTTKTELKAIAPAAMMGLKSPNAAMGMPSVL